MSDAEAAAFEYKWLQMVLAGSERIEANKFYGEWRTTELQLEALQELAERPESVAYLPVRQP